MCQREVLEIIKKQKNWRTAKEICKEFPHLSCTSVFNSLERLSRYEEILRERDEKRHCYIYKKK